MRMSLRGLAFAALLCVGTPALSGCESMLQGIAGSPSTAEINAAYAAENTYTATAKLAKAYLDSGKATPAQAKTIENANAIVYPAIVAARKAVAAGDDPALAAAMSTINTALPAFVSAVPANGS